MFVKEEKNEKYRSMRKNPNSCTIVLEGLSIRRRYEMKMTNRAQVAGLRKGMAR